MKFIIVKPKERQNEASDLLIFFFFTQQKNVLFLFFLIVLDSLVRQSQLPIPSLVISQEGLHIEYTDFNCRECLAIFLNKCSVYVYKKKQGGQGGRQTLWSFCTNPKASPPWSFLRFSISQKIRTILFTSGHFLKLLTHISANMKAQNLLQK